MMFRAYVICTSPKTQKGWTKKVLCMFASNEAGEALYATSIQFQNPIISIGANIISYIFRFVNIQMNIFLKSGYNI